jgi:type IV pilus assembly protein PilY1
MKRFLISLQLLGLFGVFFASMPAMAVEPSMADYTHYPIFQVSAVEPNILIMLDNSSSMNFNAYGTWPGNGGIVTDAPYLGEPYQGKITADVIRASDDAEEDAAGRTYDHVDLDMGSVSFVGIRFDNLDIPKGATITKAYITFTAHASDGTNTDLTNLTFRAQLDPNAATFTMGTANRDISGRPDTAASVAWNGIPGWTNDQTYQSPELKTIIQEVINLDGWASGHPLVVKVNGSGSREVLAYSDSTANMEGPKLYVEYMPPQWVRYYGYFNPDYFYYWNTNRFDHMYKKVRYVGDPRTDGYWSVQALDGTAHNLLDSEIVSSRLWDGNWLNWLSMRRIDVLRKVLMGGLATSRTGGGNQVNYGETPTISAQTFIKKFDSTNAAAVSPYDGQYHYGVGYGSIYVDVDSTPFSGQLARYDIRIQKNVLYEPQDFYNYDTGDNLAGILQKIGDKARWGNEWFNQGTGSNESGGTIVHPIGTNLVDLVNDLQNTGCDTWTPLAEAYYVATQYFKQEDPEAGLDYPNSAVPDANLGDDPYYNNGYVYCANSFVILLTDGTSEKDAKIPASLKQDFDGDGLDNFSCVESTGANCNYPDGGTHFLDDLALYARTTDLRPDLEGDQNIILYTVYAFSNDPNAESLLRSTAKNGGFDDRDGNRLPNLQVEWDKDLNGDPDTFYKASDGYALETQLLKAINDILSRAASGTAVSVLATTGEGEGTMVQAYFRPTVPVGLDEVTWTGYLQSLWVDKRGYLREDTDGNLTLDESMDKVISYYLDPATGDTRIRRYSVSADKPYPDFAADSYEVLGLDDVTAIWEAGKRLAAKNPNDRKIFTYLDKNKNKRIDEASYNPLDDSGELVRFHTASAAAIKPYLGVKNDATWSYLGATQDQRVENLIRYIRGEEISGFRTRTLDGQVWKLGDIVYSTPVPVAAPADKYHIIYSDESYYNYYVANKNRETVVYVGANDGMLHAFTSWQYDAATGAYVQPAGTTEDIGDELWAYIPQSLLPHLKWLPSRNYTHVDYVDLKPKVFDAKIDHDNNPSTQKEWRTLLVAGLNMGGKNIWADGAFDNGTGTLVNETRQFYSSYVCIDVTDPRNPRVLWDRSYQDVDLTTSFPSVVKVQDKWFVVFGSGPSTYDGTTNKNGHIFVVDLETGEPYRNGTNDWLFQTNESKAFLLSPVSLDKNLNFSTDAIYIGESYLSSTWKGKIYRIAVPTLDTDGNYDAGDPVNYEDNPRDTTHPWVLSTLFDSPAPFTAPPAVSVDDFDNAWVYVGTGRYLSTADKTSTQQNYLYGIKDPFFNKDHTLSGLYGTSYYHNYGSFLQLDSYDLFFADPYVIVQGGDDVFEGTTPIGTFQTLLSMARETNGWYRTLDITGERSLVKAAVIGGVVLVPTFVPNADVCGFGGDSYFWGLYYETGTAFYQPVFPRLGTRVITADGVDYVEVLDRVVLGAGKSAAVGVHVGTEGAEALVQQSTGAILAEKVDPALKIKSGLRSWVER